MPRNDYTGDPAIDDLIKKRERFRGIQPPKKKKKKKKKENNGTSPSDHPGFVQSGS